MDLALIVLRLTVGLLLVGHGAQKLFGWFGGHAIAKIHWPKLWVTEGGLELPLVNLAVVIAVGLTGPGVVSLDNAFGTALPPNTSLVGVGLVIAGWFFALIVSTLTAVDSSASNK